MVAAPGVSLAKVSIKAARRLIDVALPGDVPVAELLPYILRHAGEDAADAGERHAGWLLRRPTGESLDPQKSLDAQQVRDGELLHLVPGEVEWPELEYEDLVETIASGARRYGRSWGRAATRLGGLTISALIFAIGPAAVFWFEPPWLLPSLVLLAVGAVLLGAGIVIARAVPDARAGAVFAAVSMLYAFVGGLMLTAPDHARVTDVGSPQLLLAATTLLLFAIVGYVGVAVLARIFAAAIAIAALALLGALTAGRLGPDGAAAVVLAAGIGLLPGYPMVAIRLGRLPLPTLPQRSADLLADEPAPPATDVFDAAARTDEVLTGLLIGLAVVTAGSAGLLALAGGGSHQLLLLAATLALLLRARLFPVPRQRIPLLAAGVVGALLLLGLRAGGADTNTSLALLLLLLLGVGFVVAAAGLVYSRSNPSPYLGRGADILDVVSILALIPLACFITGLYHYVQSLLAGIG
ncbi:type VII secretion integral membrane protein EccD [Natronosporangium hydrolyticum]|uniref:Type VII secretion integral membrane protein EccD n=1 Tax=Natronosporangium hydrolyticum TaxID=2811111 RepID=A0A895YGU2_9ACTN|nr:type VII secretion integral membrane protein EccD [Natronosporangium hydrolyticum]QSB15312.1 type VII secretion integral membrane protein EccD [Natronosporangium hydrolyticum]